MIAAPTTEQRLIRALAYTLVGVGVVFVVVAVLRS